MFKKSNGKPSPIMTRKEVAVWVGRALSSSEVAMRMLLQAVDVITLQQQVIEALHEQIKLKAKSLQENYHGYTKSRSE